MGAEALLALFAVGFVVGKNWTRVRDFIQSAVAEVKKR